MSKQAELCAWLADHGFAIEDEALAADGDMLYRILLVRPGVWRVENPAWLYAGLPLLTTAGSVATSVFDCADTAYGACTGWYAGRSQRGCTRRRIFCVRIYRLCTK